jgi:hypothetical protein
LKSTTVFSEAVNGGSRRECEKRQYADNIGSPKESLLPTRPTVMLDCQLERFVEREHHYGDNDGRDGGARDEQTRSPPPPAHHGYDEGCRVRDDRQTTHGKDGHAQR